jgi:16S rRNA (uracil1498-N3)-methyltransferase
MRQLLVPRSLSGQPDVAVTGDDYHYLAHVRRVRAGDTVGILDSDGMAFLGTVVHVAKGSAVELRLDPAATERQAGDGALPAIDLLQAIAKGPAMDRLVRQATELGVATIVPFLAQHTVSGDGGTQSRVERWRRIARAACQQSGAAGTVVAEPHAFPELLQRWVDGSSGIVCATGASTPLIATPPPLPGVARVCVVVGPEGDLSPAELHELTARGFDAVSLGPHVLRVDTAAAAAVSATWQWLAVARMAQAELE